MSGRGEANPVFRLATRAGKMDQSCPAGYIWNFPFGWTWEWAVNQKWSYLFLIWSTERVWEFCCQLCILLLLWCKSQKVWSPILSKQISRWLYFYLFYFQGFKRIQTKIILIGLVRGFLLQWFSLVAKLKFLLNSFFRRIPSSSLHSRIPRISCVRC